MLERADFCLGRALDFALVLLGIAMVTIVFLQVLFRYAIHSPLSWTEELARYIFVWFSLLGAALAMRRKAHFGLEFIVERLPSVITAWLAIAVNVVLGLFLLLILRESVNWFALYGDQTSPAMEISFWMVFVALPVSALLILLEVMRTSVGCIQRVFKRRKQDQRTGSDLT